MQSLNGKVSPEMEKKETNGTDSCLPGESDNPINENTKLSLSDDDDDDGPRDENAENQMVLDENGVDAIVHTLESLNSCHQLSSRNESPKPPPVIASFAVQCSDCYKWRLIPTKEKYEEIRENITEKFFYCETAREWEPDISCDDPGDLEQDSSRIWAMDRPSIARPPPGWQRLLRMRGEGSSKFADVYYVAPSGKRFRSLVEIQKYLTENPELAAETDTSKFSFTIPRPLQEDYVKKRPSGVKSVRPLESSEVKLLLGQPEATTSSFETPISNSSDQPAKKRAKKSSTEGNVP